MLLDFIIRKSYLWDHLKPIWDALPENQRGMVYMPAAIFDEIQSRSPDIEGHYRNYVEGQALGDLPILAAAYGDAVRAADANLKRPTILIEHGVGLTFGKAEYANGLGQRAKFALMPVQSQYILNKIHPDLKNIPHPIVGVPKLDKWAGEFSKPHPIPDKPTIAIAFHHGNKESRPPEIGSAWEHYIDFIPELAKRYKVLLHYHPLSGGELTGALNGLMNLSEARGLGMEITNDFEEVMRRADVYLNDCSSTLYEFLVTGKPVIILNAPWFYPKTQWGLRFWDYADVGQQVEIDVDLIPAINDALANPDRYRPFRSRAVSDLFPFMGHSTQKMIEAISACAGLHKPAPVTMPVIRQVIEPVKPAPTIRKSMARGIIYIAFGVNAWREMEKSIRSLRAVGSDLPVAIVGELMQDHLVMNPEVTFIPWAGDPPFNMKEHRVNFRFQAAIVKSALYRLSPFAETLYVDCDTEFMQNPEAGFGHLAHWDFLIAQEKQAVNELYNEPNPRHWDHDLPERDLTVAEMGGDGNFPMINSGVFFWKKKKAVEELFDLWSIEWLRFQYWDDQKALYRALDKSRVRMFLLSMGWNSPDKEKAMMIFHAYGQGMARSQG